VGIGLAIVVVLMAAPPSEPPRGVLLSCDASVPSQFDSEARSPGVGTIRDRYVWAYEAFCWNCVQVRSGDLQARCPFICSGSYSATEGCRDGAQHATDGIEALLVSSGPERVREYLRRLATSPEGREKAELYFPDGPVAEGEENAQ
jgi:hypothetical protein